MSIAQSVCVFVALGIQHAMRMRHIFQRKKLLNIKNVFRVSLQLLSENIFHSKNN